MRYTQVEEENARLRAQIVPARQAVQQAVQQMKVYADSVQRSLAVAREWRTPERAASMEE